MRRPDGEKWRGIKEHGDRWRELGLVFRKRDVSPRFSVPLRSDQPDAQIGFWFFFIRLAPTWLKLLH